MTPDPFIHISCIFYCVFSVLFRTPSVFTASLLQNGWTSLLFLSPHSSPNLSYITRAAPPPPPQPAARKLSPKQSSSRRTSTPWGYRTGSRVTNHPQRLPQLRTPGHLQSKHLTASRADWELLYQSHHEVCGGRSGELRSVEKQQVWASWGTAACSLCPRRQAHAGHTGHCPPVLTHAW